MNETFLIQEINSIKSQIAHIQNTIQVLSNSISKQVSIQGPPGPKVIKVTKATKVIQVKKVLPDHVVILDHKAFKV